MDEIEPVEARRRSVAAASSALSPTSPVAERASLGQAAMVEDNLDSHLEPAPKKAAAGRDCKVTCGCADRTWQRLQLLQVKNRWNSAFAAPLTGDGDLAPGVGLWPAGWNDSQHSSDWMPPFLRRPDKSG
jgi:hypothetical protein